MVEKHLSDDEGTDFLSAFKGAFGSSANTAARLKAERRAGRTPKERSRGGKGLTRSVQINFRATTETQALLKSLADALDGSVADVIEKAVLAMAKTHKVGVSTNA